MRGDFKKLTILFISWLTLTLSDKNILRRFLLLEKQILILKGGWKWNFRTQESSVFQPCQHCFYLGAPCPVRPLLRPQSIAVFLWSDLCRASTVCDRTGQPLEYSGTTGKPVWRRRRRRHYLQRRGIYRTPLWLDNGPVRTRIKHTFSVTAPIPPQSEPYPEHDRSNRNFVFSG